MRLNRRVKLKIKGIVWMHVVDVQEEEQIGLVECREMPNGRVHGIDGVQCPAGGDQTVETAHYAMGNTMGGGERCSTVVALRLHLLGYCRHVERKFIAGLLVEDLCMMRIVSCLNGGMRRQGVLRGRKMLVEDDSA